MSAASSFAASWRDAAGEQTRTTWGGTICWYPREQSKLVSYDSASGDEHIIRCGFCPGCLEFDRRRLAERLEEHYQNEERDIWILSIECPIQMQTRLRRRFSRTTIGKSSEGFYRQSAREFAQIVVGQKPALRALRTLRGFRYSLQKCRRSRKKRAWKSLTSGILVHRETWGEWKNRFYHRGLPIAKRQNWSIDTVKGLRKRHPEAKSGARAHRNGEFLYPPIAWKPPRLNRRKGPIRNRFARTASGDSRSSASPMSTLIAGAVAHLSPKADAERRLTLHKVAGSPNSPTRTEAVGQRFDALPQSAGVPSASELPRKNRSLNLIQGTGYKGSDHVEKPLPDWAQRFADLGKAKPP